MTAGIGLAVRNWIERFKGIVLVGGVTLGVVSGYAFAVSPTVDAGHDFLNGVTLVGASAGPAAVYTVPAGRQYTLTDVVVTNTTSSVQSVSVAASDQENCTTKATRLNSILVQPFSSIHLPLNTGIGFAAGKNVCFTAGLNVLWTLRGYLSSGS